METLKCGIYKIPDGHVDKIYKGTIEIRKSKSNNNPIRPTDKRCKNCVYFEKGHHSENQWWTLYVCKAKPKKNKKDLFYATKDCLGKNCDLFKLKEEN